MKFPTFRYGDFVEIKLYGQSIKINNGGSSGSKEQKLYFSHNGGSIKELTPENVSELKESFMFMVNELERYLEPPVETKTEIRVEI